MVITVYIYIWDERNHSAIPIPNEARGDIIQIRLYDFSELLLLLLASPVVTVSQPLHPFPNLSIIKAGQAINLKTKQWSISEDGRCESSCPVWNLQMGESGFPMQTSSSFSFPITESVSSLCYSFAVTSCQWYSSIWPSLETLSVERVGLPMSWWPAWLPEPRSSWPQNLPSPAGGMDRKW